MKTKLFHVFVACLAGVAAILSSCNKPPHVEEPPEPPVVVPTYAIGVASALEHATVTVKVDGVGVTKAEAGKRVDISIVADEGYDFQKWELTAASSEGSAADLNSLLGDETAAATSFTMPEEAVVLSAVVALIPPSTYSIAVTIGENGSVVITTYEADGETVAQTSADGSLDGILAGTAVRIEATAADHYQFAGWTDVSGYTPATASAPTLAFDMPAADVAMSAGFEAKPTKALTWSASNGSISVSVDGTAISSGSQVEAGATVEISANPASTWEFSEWTGQISFADKNANPTTFEMPIFDSSFGVTFVPRTSMLTITQPAQGSVITVKVDGVTVESGSRVAWNKSVQVVASGIPEGWIFGQWSATHDLGTVSFDNKSAEETAFQMPSNDVALTCTLEEYIPAEPDTFIEIGGIKWARFNLNGNNTFVENETDPGLLYQAGVNVGFAKGGDNAAANAIPTPAGKPFRSNNNYSTTSPTPSWDTQNPCPEGWKVPSKADYVALVAATTCVLSDDKTYATLTAKADTSKAIVFPITGSYSGWSSTAPTYAAANNGYWTTTGQGYAGNFYYFTFYGSDLAPNTNQSTEPYKAYSIRCIQK